MPQKVLAIKIYSDMVVKPNTCHMLKMKKDFFMSSGFWNKGFYSYIFRNRIQKNPNPDDSYIMMMTEVMQKTLRASSLQS